MSYLSFLHIQCNMGNEEKKIYTYVIFGKREQLEQFPQIGPVEIHVGFDEVAEFRPVFLFWDRTDEILVGFYGKWAKSEKRGIGPAFGKAISALIKNHIQNKYKEVFLSHPETLFLSENAECEIIPDFWEERPDKKQHLYDGAGKMRAYHVLAQSKEPVSLFIIPGEDCRYDVLLDWIIAAEKAAGLNIADLFLFGTAEQKDNCEEILESFYEKTGLAGSFLPVSECRKMVAYAKDEVLLLDGVGLSIGQIGRPVYYIDAAGVRTGKEMKRFSGVCKVCYSLRNHLDRAFLSAL